MTNRTTEKGGDSLRAESLQFSLWGLMWFMLAASVYFSQIPLFPMPLWDWDFNAYTVVTVLVAWFVLGAFYLRCRLKGAVVVHCFALGLVLLFLLMPVFLVGPIGILSHLDEILSELDEIGEVLIRSLYAGNVCSFPAAVLMLLVVAFEGAFGQGRRQSVA